VALESGPKKRSNVSLLVTRVQERYTDAYRVARALHWFGQIIKIAGFLVAVFIFIDRAESLKSPGAGLTAGVVVGAILFISGIIVAAQGQMLKAVIDTAVNSSPFLDDSQRASIMSLLGASGPSRSAGHLAAGHELKTTEYDARASGEEIASPFCYHCGAEITEESGVCSECGKQL
jgi:hypothetical protein